MGGTPNLLVLNSQAIKIGQNYINISTAITGSPGSMLAATIDSNLIQCMRIYDICSKCDVFVKYK